MSEKARPSRSYGSEESGGDVPATRLAAQRALAGEMDMAINAERHGECSLGGPDAGGTVAVRDEQEAVRHSVTNQAARSEVLNVSEVDLVNAVGPHQELGSHPDVLVRVVGNQPPFEEGHGSL